MQNTVLHRHSILCWQYAKHCFAYWFPC